MKWEYRVAKIPEDTEWEEWLNQFGSEGWELVSFLPNRDHVFKRPINSHHWDNIENPDRSPIAELAKLPHFEWRIPDTLPVHDPYPNIPGEWVKQKTPDGLTQWVKIPLEDKD